MVDSDKVDQLENMLGQSEMMITEDDRQDNMVESQSRAYGSNVNIEGCEGVSSSIRKSLEILLKPFGKVVTVSCPVKSPSVGLTYTRWGSSSCPTGAEKLYAGRISSSAYNQVGGANYLCMPETPQNGDLDVTMPLVSTANRIGRLFGTEYEYPKRQGGHDQNAVCAVCYVQKRSAQVMILAQATCPDGWIREYYGYLMGETNIPGHASSSEYICVDKAQDYVSGLQANTNGAVLYHIATSCNGFDCPPYSTEKVLTCSVCSK